MESNVSHNYRVEGTLVYPKRLRYPSSLLMLKRLNFNIWFNWQCSKVYCVNAFESWKQWQSYNSRIYNFEPLTRKYVIRDRVKSNITEKLLKLFSIFLFLFFLIGKVLKWSMGLHRILNINQFSRFPTENWFKISRPKLNNIVSSCYKFFHSFRKRKRDAVDISKSWWITRTFTTNMKIPVLLIKFRFVKWRFESSLSYNWKRVEIKTFIVLRETFLKISITKTRSSLDEHNVRLEIFV